MMNLDELKELDPKDFEGKFLSQGKILEWFKICDAFWAHDGNPEKPHAKLTSGWCSNGFFDCLRVLGHINLSDILANQLAQKIRDEIGEQKIDWVIGSPMAGITFAHDVARALKAPMPINMFVEKDATDPKGKRMLWKRMTIPEDAHVLQIEELTTTAGTLNEVERAVREGNSGPVNFLPYVGILVHRPPKLPITHYGQRRVIALVEKEIWAVKPSECPLCKAGSKPLRPKTHWKELTK